ncbi:WAT1-related protein [Spatholobus suberectus]|nr:WAT1-related protein [Spatholobus suberectus]
MFQASVTKKYPVVTVIVFFQTLFSAIQCAVFSLITVRDPREWELKFDKRLIAILYQAIAATLIRYILSTWCVHRAGPLFCAILIGAVIIVVGFYAVLWGKSREENKIGKGGDNLESSCHHVPLLQNRAQQVG